ncbi:nucleoside-diphosphate-sugar epimerase [Fusarium phyllophilum]|uniref:Nucleoside-diphosphate-sugar epimerase n=1 Tax=Fusarium phyllophilum TaxID=47803 RepID=A0A8H5MY18_9HYPO|nr:nucleoside-diphosphate-sugar epimerase [Fusarium phyllophilum]
MHLILTGATGLVGSGVFDAMLRSKDITKISILSRRPVPMAAGDPRVNVITHNDFTRYNSEVLDQLQDANGVVWALGISQLKVTKDEYVTITKDFPVAAAKAFSKISPTKEPFRFIYVSGHGATLEPTSFTPIFGRVKGETERALSELQAPTKFHVESVRPAGVDATNHEAIKPYIPNPGMLYNAMYLLMGPLVRTVLQSLHSPTEKLGPFLMNMAMGKYDKPLEAVGNDISSINGSRILENVAFQRLYEK